MVERTVMNSFGTILVESCKWKKVALAPLERVKKEKEITGKLLPFLSHQKQQRRISIKSKIEKSSLVISAAIASGYKGHMTTNV